MKLGEITNRLGRLAGGRWLPLKWGVAVAAAVLALHALGAFGVIEPLFTDMHFALRGALPPSGEVVIVGVSRQCIGVNRQGPWPWKRSVHAEIIDKISAGGARAICYDMYFSTPSADPTEDQGAPEAPAPEEGL